MKHLSEFIKEASINAKKQNINFAKKLYIKGKAVGGIGCFGILTAENPDSGTNVSQKENNKLLGSLKRDLKKNRHIFIPIDGYFKGNKERSLLVFNIKTDELSKYAGMYQQTSFFWCRPVDNGGIECQYWEKEDREAPYHHKDNPYVHINSTKDIIMPGDDEAYSIIGGDFKYSINPEVFFRISECIMEGVGEAVRLREYFDDETALDTAFNKIGWFESYVHSVVTKPFFENLKEHED